MSDVVVTPRLEIRPPAEADRTRFVHLFCDDGFMVFGGVLSTQDAETRFDRMLAVSAEVSFGKRPIVERSSGDVIGYTGVDRIDLDGRTWWEWGYRLVPGARGHGYATEASRALLVVAEAEFAGEILAIVDPSNKRSQNVAGKLGFGYWKQAVVEGSARNLYRLGLPRRPN